MSDKLVTIAIFGTPTEAAIGRSQLEAEGIRVYMADEVTVGMAWYLSTAVGGVKLEVMEHDADRALSILEAGDEPVSISDEDWQLDEVDEESAWELEDEDELVSVVDEMAHRALYAAVLGLFFFPLHLYSLWLVMRLVFGDTSLNAVNRRRIMIAVLFDVLVVLVWLLAWLTVRSMSVEVADFMTM